MRMLLRMKIRILPTHANLSLFFMIVTGTLLLLSSDTAYQAQGCSVVLHVVESTDETIM